MLKKALVAAVAAAMLTGTAFAARGGGGGGGGDAGHVTQAAAVNSNSMGSMDRDKGVDRAVDRRSDARIAHPTTPVVRQPATGTPEPARAIPNRSTMGRLNTNNPSSPHRATGLARADYRHDMKDGRTLKGHKVATKVTPHKTLHKAAHRTLTPKAPSTTIHRVNEAPDFRASRSRAQRMEQARLKWASTRRS